jgi:hypothetical protein
MWQFGLTGAGWVDDSVLGVVFIAKKNDLSINGLLLIYYFT